jgi:hypothetical protein
MPYILKGTPSPIRYLLSLYFVFVFSQAALCSLAALQADTARELPAHEKRLPA